MTCNQVASGNLIERYVEGKLDPGLRDDFESHYFECESCLAFLRTSQTIRPVLADLPSPVTASRRLPALHWLGLAAAATVVIAVLSWPRSKPDPVTASAPPAQTAPATPPVLLLAEIRPAPYEPAVFRDGGANPAPDFAAAMRLYQDRQWKDAAQALAALARGPSPHPAALHFEGISRLLANQTEAALASLDRVIAIGAASPFEEEARFYRAQALLLGGRIPEARRELERVIERRGDYEAPARALLNRF